MHVIILSRLPLPRSEVSSYTGVELGTVGSNFSNVVVAGSNVSARIKETTIVIELHIVVQIISVIVPCLYGIA